MDFENTITHAFDLACPLVSVKQYNFQISKATLELIRLKRKYRKLASRDRSLRPEANRLQREANLKIAQEKSEAWQKVTAELNHHNGRTFWNMFKKLTKTSKSNKFRVPNLKLENGSTSNDPKIVANTFAKSLSLTHQTHEGTDFDDQHKKVVESYSKSNINSLLPNFNAQELELEEVSILTEQINIEELNTALKKCKTKGAPGPDGVSFQLLKKLPDLALQYLLQTYNACLYHGYFPKRWKVAHGIMNPKPGKDNSSVKNYRTNSLLNSTCKLYERLIRRIILHHLLDLEIFNEWQRGNLPKK
jgi:hypothetical protein